MPFAGIKQPASSNAFGTEKKSHAVESPWPWSSSRAERSPVYEEGFRGGGSGRRCHLLLPWRDVGGQRG
jgi:hypothetical protein